MITNKSGWKGESRRHSLARKGIKTASGKPNYIADAKHELLRSKSYIDSFLAEIKDFKKEYEWKIVNGQIQRIVGEKTKVKSEIKEEFVGQNEIITIHNHPYNMPPSSNDIHIFLMSGKHIEDAIILPDKTTYILKRKPSTGNLTYIKPLTEEQFQKSIPAINREVRSSKMTFGKQYMTYARIYHAQGIKGEFELQEKLLYKFSELYDFEVIKYKSGVN